MMQVMSTQVGGIRIELDLLAEVSRAFQYLSSIIIKTGITDGDVLARLGKQGKARQVFVMLAQYAEVRLYRARRKLRIFSSNVK